MRLYEINAQLESALNKAFDIDTGEILDEQELQKFFDLELLKGEKEENTCLYIKGLRAELDALIKEREWFNKKIEGVQKQIDYLKDYVSKSLDGEKLKTNRVSVYFTTHERVEFEDIDKLPEEFKTTKVIVSADRKAIKERLKSGEEIEGCSLVKNSSIVIR